MSTHGETDDCFEALDAEMAGEKDILGIDVVLGSVVIIFSSGLAIISHRLSFLYFFPLFLIKEKNRCLDEVIGKKKDEKKTKRKKKSYLISQRIISGKSLIIRRTRAFAIPKHSYHDNMIFSKRSSSKSQSRIDPSSEASGYQNSSFGRSGIDRLVSNLDRLFGSACESEVWDFESLV